MLDSGNTLRDYLTHLPVIVLPEEAGRRRMGLSGAALRPIFADTAGGRQMMGVLTPQAIWPHLPVIVLPEEAGRRRMGLSGAALRPIFADTAGGRQMMGVLTPQAIWLETEGRRQAVRAVVALSPGLRAGAPALVPAALLEENLES